MAGPRLYVEVEDVALYSALAEQAEVVEQRHGHLHPAGRVPGAAGASPARARGSAGR